MKAGLLGGVLLTSVAIAATASAATITEQFTIGVPAGTPVGTGFNAASSPFAQFDPSLGSLDSVQTQFSGTAQFAGVSPYLDLSLVSHGTAIVIGAEQDFFTPGSAMFDLGGVDRYLPEISVFIGTGTAQVDLRVLGNGGTFSLPPTDGTITFDYTPAAAVPEPALGALFCLAFAALVAANGSGRPARAARKSVSSARMRAGAAR